MRARHLITAACLFAALGLYGAGAKDGAALIMCGLAFELAFWIRLARSRKQP